MRRLKWTSLSAAILGIAAVGALWQIRQDIEQQSRRDEAQPADVIIVLGAAEYHGRPSPVLRARLDHARTLYQRGLASKILTTGGSGGDELFTESEVGRAYLSGLGIPAEAILVENEGQTTAYSTAAAAEIMRRHELKSAIVVSDGYHIFRVKKMLQAQGFRVYGSPRPDRTGTSGTWVYWRQAVGYALWSLGIPV